MPVIRPIDLITPEFVAELDERQRAELAYLLKIRANQLGLKPKALPWGTDNPAELLYQIAPRALSKRFSPEHEQFWSWVWGIEPGVRPDALAVCMPRGRGKSSSMELASALLMAHGRRRFVWYVSGTQQLADAHVEAIAAIIESDEFSSRYPYMRPKLGKYGNQKAWRRQRIMAEGPDGIAVTVEAVGLETGTRGVKAEFQRPDLIVFDDTDAQSDSHQVVLRKLATITQAVIPAGSDDAGLVFVQNLVHANSLMRRVIEPDAFDPDERWMSQARVIGPTVAVEGCRIEILPDDTHPGRTRPTIVAGAATWEGQPLDQMQSLLDRIGIRSFMTEMQNSVQARAGGVFSHVTFRRCTPDQIPWKDIVATVVAVDPAVTEHDGSDATGIQVDCIAETGEIYRLFSWERRASPTEAVKTAILKALEYRASSILIETNQGGLTWTSVFKEAYADLERQGKISEDWHRPSTVFVKVGSNRSKVERAQAMVPDYERGVIIHVDGETSALLESALYRFPLTEPDDLVDSAVHAHAFLRRLRKAPQIGGNVLSVGAANTKWANPAGRSNQTDSNSRSDMDDAASRRTARAIGSNPGSWSVGGGTTGWRLPG
jgi:phage terminase large subunit-like protein